MDSIDERPAIEHQMRGNGLSLRVVVNPGTSSGTPLLLMNGIGARLELLQPLVEELDPERTVIRFDAPSIGGSPQSSRPYRFRRLCGALAEILDQLGYDEVDVLGISWGGGLAQQFAFSKRSRCRRVVLVSTGTGSIMVPAHPRVLKKMITPRRYTDPAFLEEVAQDLYGGTMRVNPAAAISALKAQKADTISRGYFMQLGAGAMWTSLFFLPLVRKRTLILAGDDDPLIPQMNARMLGKLIPRSEVHIYEGGHLALVTEAELLAPRITEFLDAE